MKYDNLTTHLHVSMVCWIQVFSQGTRTGTLTAVRVVSFGEYDPGPPADLIKVYVQVDSATERFLTPSLGRLQASHSLLSLAPFAPAPLRPAGLFDFGGGQELGLLSCVE